MQMIVLVGLSGSGKSTYANYNFPATAIVNQDILGSRDRCAKLARTRLFLGQDVIIDRTNLTTGQRKFWIDLARQYGAAVSAWVFKTPIEKCVERVQTRANHKMDDPKVVYMQSHRFSEPTLQEGFDSISIVDTCQPTIGVVE